MKNNDFATGLRMALALPVCGFLTLPLSVVAATAATAEDDDRAVEHVLVTVPMHRKESATALPVTVLSGEELHGQIATSIGETLASKPGLASASFGPAVGQPVIRGQQGARVTMLQNSTASADASTSSADHAVSVEPVLADSIEVLRGPATLLYGWGAIGGVVNVIDKRIPVAVPDEISGAAELRHASVNDETTGVFALNGGKDSLAFHVDGMSRQSNNVRIPGVAAEHDDGDSSDGYIANSDADTQSYTLGGSYIFDRGFIGVAVNQLDNEYGIPPGVHDHSGEGEVRLDVEQTRYDLRADYHPKTSAVETVKWFFTLSDYQHRELEGAEVGTRFSNDSWENRLELVHQPIAGWHGVVGLQQREFEFAAVGEESFIPRTDVSRYGLFVVEDYHYASLLFEVGARWDRDELDPQPAARKQSFDSNSLSGSVLWQINDPWSFGVALSSSQRAPVIEELYSNVGNSLGNYVEHVASGTIELGNPVLDSEQANNLDITASYQGDAIEGYLTLFYNDFSDYIYLAATGEVQVDTPIYRYKQQDATFSGAEFELTLQLGGEVALDLFGDWLSGQLDNGADIPRLPPPRLGSRLSWDVGSISSYLMVTHAENQDKPGANEEPTEGYNRWDAGVDLQLSGPGRGDTLLFVKLKNLTDEEIRNATSLLREVAPEPGRSIESGIRITF